MLKIDKQAVHCIIREFFLRNGFDEVVTPSLIPAPVPEAHIDFFDVNGQYLRPSPEIEMKILLSEGMSKIFQIGPCFRKGEVGRLHKEEFTMLEWYQVGADYNTIAKFAKEMLLYLANKLYSSDEIIFQGQKVHLGGDWYEFSISELFEEFANITPEQAIEDETFEQVLVERIEQNLPHDRPVIVKDYPAHFAALAKLKNTNPAVAERWELYIAGIELANTYSELTDPEENLARFAKFAEERKQNKLPQVPVSDDFLNALKRGIPECAGSAMGLDRLAMIFTDSVL